MSGETLESLARNEDRFGQLERLEIAEHLAFCDYCMQRYALALEDGVLLVPARSCEKTLRTRIRSRALRLITSRYATAAAAVTLALTMLWGGEPAKITRPVLPEDRPSISRQLTGLTGEIGDSLRETVGGISDFFDGFRPGRILEGGNKV